MKKIYSIVLMATALLFSTSISAKVLQGSTEKDLQQAIYNIMSGNESDTVIKLSQPVTLERTIWVGTKDEGGDFKSITIDLNGYNITMNGKLKDDAQPDQNSNRNKLIMFSLTHGELKIINKSATEAKVQLTGKTASNSRIFEVFGTYRNSRWNDAGTALEGTAINTRNQGWFSHLEIGTNVLLYAAPGCRAEGIAIASQGTREYYKDATNKVTTTYGGNIFTGSWGFAQGVRVDFKGKMDIQGDGLTAKEVENNANPANTRIDAKVYGFSVKGTIRSALSASKEKQAGAEKIETSITYTKGYAGNYYNNNGTVEATSGVTHKLDTLDAPFIYIYPESEIKVRNDGDKVAAIYAGGYAKWLVEGYAAGKTGMYVSSGTVDLQDAYVKSTANAWENTSNIGSANGGGSGVVLNSRDSYAGDMDFVVSGDTKIESIKGYAIEEAVNTTTVVPNPKADPENENYVEGSDPYIPASNVSNITINGGTIEGGDKGAIIISGPTDAATAATNPEATTVVVYGGNVEGTTVVGTNGDLDEITATGTHTTEVKDEKGNTIIVVSKGDPLDQMSLAAAKDAYTDWFNGGKKTNDSISVKLTGAIAAADGILNADYQFKELELNANEAQVLTVAAPYTLEVGRVVLGEKAQIIVEAGANFIVTGGQGIVAPKIDNIVLKHNSTTGKYATFLFNPAVTSNKHPNATYEIESYSWRVTSTNAQTEVFGIPTYNAIKSVVCMDAGKYGYIQVYGNNGTWENIAFTDDNPFPYEKLNRPFAAYALTAYRDPSDPKLTFRFGGELVGNTNATLTKNLRWSFFANSYTAEVDLATFLAGLNTTTQVEDDKAVYVADMTGTDEYGRQHWTWEALDADAIGDAGNPTKVQPMRGFLLPNTGTQIESNAINYKTMVYDPAVNALAGAPRRNLAVSNNTAKLYVVVTNEEGVRDNVKFRETENTKSVEKYMNSDVNIYATTDKKSAILAAEDLENTYVGFSTVKGGKFTISFANVDGREFDLIDHATNTRVAVAEDNTYEFFADANSANDYRFEIVERANVPTAIENTEAVKSAKGVYTITGMYVGEMNVWNTLPAGVYVVNGEKRVK